MHAPVRRGASGEPRRSLSDGPLAGAKHLVRDVPRALLRHGPCVPVSMDHLTPQNWKKWPKISAIGCVSACAAGTALRRRRPRGLFPGAMIAGALGLFACSSDTMKSSESAYRPSPHILSEEGNTCPDTLIHAGSAPGILCETPGETCADNDHYCECGYETFEGAPWRCVVTQPGCPSELPEEGTVCDSAQTCDFESGGRVRCSCDEGAWSCEDIDDFCSASGVQTGDRCAGHEGETCNFFNPAFPSGAPALNLDCSCVNEEWQCSDGCPIEFPGLDDACEPSIGVVRCGWRTESGLLSCSCLQSGWDCFTVSED